MTKEMAASLGENGWTLSRNDQPFFSIDQPIFKIDQPISQKDWIRSQPMPQGVLAEIDQPILAN